LSLDLVLQGRDSELSFLDRGSLGANRSVSRSPFKKEALPKYSHDSMAQFNEIFTRQHGAIQRNIHTTAWRNSTKYSHDSMAQFNENSHKRIVKI
jgi:hypothetical protein